MVASSGVKLSVNNCDVNFILTSFILLVACSGRIFMKGVDDLVRPFYGSRSYNSPYFRRPSYLLVLAAPALRAGLAKVEFDHVSETKKKS